MRQFFWKLEAEATRIEDGWDYTRNIIAGYHGKDPKQIMPLRRDKLIITDALIAKAKVFHEKMLSYGKN